MSKARVNKITGALPNSRPNRLSVAGVDGCRGGWIVAVLPAGGSPVTLTLAPTIAAVASETQACAVVAIDMPIGLCDAAEPGGRPCDREARMLLPPGWKSSVFAPPCRAVLAARDYAEALQLNRASSPEQIGISIQAWNIVPKIKELDDFLQSGQRPNWIETFPELAFLRMNEGRALGFKKKTAAGQDERLDLLCRSLGAIQPDLFAPFSRTQVQPDDILDALACAWVAACYSAGNSHVVGDPKMTDGRDLPMRIHF